MLSFFITDVFTDAPGPAAPYPTGIVSTASSAEVVSSQGEVLGASRERVVGQGEGRNYHTYKKLAIRLFLRVILQGIYLMISKKENFYFVEGKEA